MVRMQLEQVLINLIRNSMEAIEENAGSDGCVEIRTALSDDDSIEFVITDNGVGISAGMADLLFKPFNTNKKSGMGIGLSFCRSIIEADGGNMWFDHALKRGARFGIRLPLATTMATS